MTGLPDLPLQFCLDIMNGLSRLAAPCLLLMCRVSMILGLEVLRLLLGTFGILGHNFSNSADIPRICGNLQER